MPPSTISRLLMFTAVTAIAAALAPIGVAAAEDDMLVPPTPKERASAELIFLPDEASALDAPLRQGERRVLMTGAYSSGDRFAPEGFVLRQGDASLARLQGWDGLLLIDKAGRASLHDVSKVRFNGKNWNLRERVERRAFVKLAAQAGVSAVQSHLLVNEGSLDLKDSPTAPRFRRRLMFETQDGRIGVYDSSPRMMTLFEAANALQSSVNPRFALNLDMGNYDFCETQSADGSRLCGLLNRAGIKKLTNVLAITLPSSGDPKKR